MTPKTKQILSEIYCVIAIIAVATGTLWLLSQLAAHENPKHLDNKAYLECRERYVAIDGDIENCELLLTEETK